MSTKISKYFTLEELTYSDTAKQRNISNIPSEEHKKNLQKLALEVLDPIREKFGQPIGINSGYRGPKLNAAVGGSKTSQHCNGAAADIRCKGSKAKLFRLIESMIKNGEIKVGQLIWEYGTKQEPNWIHISLPYTKVNNILYIYS
jgi:uncharacterized protein YcbK (DUF882 family)